MSVRPNRELSKELEADLSRMLERAASSAANDLRENISAGARSGRQYPGLPRRSSAAGEYPQEQFGDLLSSVEANPTNDPLRFEVGFFGDDQGKLNNLEFAPASMGGRKPLARLFNDAQVRRRMVEAMRDSS